MHNKQKNNTSPTASYNNRIMNSWIIIQQAINNVSYVAKNKWFYQLIESNLNQTAMQYIYNMFKYCNLNHIQS